MLQKLFSHTFAEVLFKNRYIHKCISAILLVILLLIHSIKLLHTHSSNNSFSNHICSGNCFEKNDNSDLAKSSSDCGICNYQLTKDADDLVYPGFCNPVIEQNDLIARTFLTSPIKSNISFDTHRSFWAFHFINHELYKVIKIFCNRLFIPCFSSDQ